MADDPFYHPLREQAWRRKLTAAEEAQLRDWLAAHPDARGHWEDEAALNELMCRLVDVPVPSNFTARVLQTLERDTAAGARKPANGWRLWRPHVWLARAAVAAILLSAGMVSYRQVIVARRGGLAESVVAVSDVSSLPSPEILTNFDVIFALNQAPPADEQLLALMK